MSIEIDDSPVSQHHDASDSSVTASTTSSIPSSETVTQTAGCLAQGGRSDASTSATARGNNLWSRINDLFHSLLTAPLKSSCGAVQKPKISPSETLIANELKVSVQHLETILSPLRHNRILVKSSFPQVHCGPVEAHYGKCTRTIGKGTGGIVRLFLREDGCQFAVKEFLHRDTDSAHDYAAGLVKEYCIASILRHPNIVKTVDLVIDSGRIFEVMEFCLCDLYSFICQGQYGKAEVYCCFRQILEGVQYLHQQGIAHRDLKPENICLDSHAQIKIIDFGLSSVFKSRHVETKCKGICGSAPYIAPEEWRQNVAYDPRKVDIWSLGIIFMTLHFQGFPWETATMFDEKYASYVGCIRHGTVYPLFQRLDPECRELITSMLHPAPARRPSITEICSSNWITNIEVCQDCQARSSVHHHFQSPAGKK
eukprot:Partr_v1_DN26349_c0_g1_i2_m43065 putative serine threonine protein kinase